MLTPFDSWSPHSGDNSWGCSLVEGLRRVHLIVWHLVLEISLRVILLFNLADSLMEGLR